MRLLRLLTTPLLSPATYTRWAYLILGGAVFLPYLMATLVLTSMALNGGIPDPPQQETGAPLLIAFAAALPLTTATAWIPGAHTLEGHLTRALLGGPITGEPIAESASRRSRARTGCWLTLHLTTGFAACLATMVLLTEAALMALLPFSTSPGSLLRHSLTFIGHAPLSTPQRLLAPLNGAAVLLGLIYALALLGAALARLAPRLLGPSTTQRLALAQQHAHTLAQRNQLARELHDSIGHALSVVALQAGAAARVITTDPDFARHALEAIADQARTATAELDHVLGLLRHEAPPTAPHPDLADLDQLIDATRALGTDLRTRIEGDTAAVPGTVSRETYRICQEGITNALRHAGAAPITLHLAIGNDRLDVEITNPCTPAPPRRTRTGRGLRGLRERLHLLGGTLHAGPHNGHWRLHAAISWKDRH